MNKQYPSRCLVPGVGTCHTEFSLDLPLSHYVEDVQYYVYNTEYNTNLLMNCRKASAKLSGIAKW